MTSVTHGVTMSGRTHFNLVPDPRAEEEIRRLLSVLDGSQRFSMVLWALPPGVEFDDVDHRSWPQEYIQAAGSRDRMTVEIRRLVDETPQQCVVGRGTGQDAGDGEPHQVIHWNGCETEVLPREVFAADEAGDLFVAYYRAARIPQPYILRLLRL